MRWKRQFSSVVILLVCSSCLWAQQAKRTSPQRTYPPQLSGAKVEVYKTVGDTQLKMYIFEPSRGGAPERKPAIVFFFGGGWRNGSPQQFEHQCRYLASRGIVAITADYRVESRHSATVDQCISDARSAIRWVRQHAEQLGVDPNRIAAGGGSAGGHLAAAAALISEFDDPQDDGTVSAVPNALVLFNPAVALAPFAGSPAFSPEQQQQLAQRIGVEPTRVSPVHHVRKGAPPSIIFFGTDDRLLAVPQYMQQQMQAVGSRCELKTWEGLPHGFFNWQRFANRPFRETLLATDAFLVSLGYLTGPPTLDQYLTTATGN